MNCKNQQTNPLYQFKIPLKRSQEYISPNFTSRLRIYTQTQQQIPQTQSILSVERLQECIQSDDNFKNEVLKLCKHPVQLQKTQKEKQTDLYRKQLKQIQEKADSDIRQQLIDAKVECVTKCLQKPLDQLNTARQISKQHRSRQEAMIIYKLLND